MKKGFIKWILESNGLGIILLLLGVLLSWYISIFDYINNHSITGLAGSSVFTVAYIIVFVVEYLKYKNGN